MKSSERQTKRSSWFKLACVLLPALAWASSSALAGMGFGGDTIGTHPDSGHGGGGDGMSYEARPMLFVEGPAELLLGDAVQAFGPGEILGVASSTPGLMRLEFTPTLEVQIDRAALDQLTVGFHFAPRGGETQVAWTWAGGRTQVTTYDIGTTLAMPLRELLVRGQLDQGIEMHAFHRVARRTVYSVSANDGAIFIARR